jgi:hypothetical protein
MAKARPAAQAASRKRRLKAGRARGRRARLAPPPDWLTRRREGSEGAKGLIARMRFDDPSRSGQVLRMVRGFAPRPGTRFAPSFSFAIFA